MFPHARRHHQRSAAPGTDPSPRTAWVLEIAHIGHTWSRRTGLHRSRARFLFAQRHAWPTKVADDPFRLSGAMLRTSALATKRSGATTVWNSPDFAES